jgi:hypothetical protein
MPILIIQTDGDNNPAVLRCRADTLEQMPDLNASIGNIGGVDAKYIRLTDNETIGASITKLINVRLSKAESAGNLPGQNLLPENPSTDGNFWR